MADEEVQAIRQVRHEISSEYGHDVHRVVRYYREIERELKRSGQFRFEEGPPSRHSGTGQTNVKIEPAK